MKRENGAWGEISANRVADEEHIKIYKDHCDATHLTMDGSDLTKGRGKKKAKKWIR